LLYLLDYGVDTIYEEYLTVDPTVVQQVTRQMTSLAAWAGRELGDEALNVLASVQPRFLDAFHDGVAERHGSVDRYLREFLAIDEDQIRMLQDRYLAR
jgi:protein-tyrosine phosphatase